MAKTYELNFVESARREWNKLNPATRGQFTNILERRLENPRVPSAALRGMKDCYKIKLREAGWRLVYQVRDETVTVTVIAIGKRDREEAYKAAARRL